MELPLNYVDGGAAIAKAIGNNPNWRLFRVPHATAATPQADMQAVDPMTKLPAKWLVSTPELALKFSATCYLTAVRWQANAERARGVGVCALLCVCARKVRRGIALSSSQGSSWC